MPKNCLKLIFICQLTCLLTMQTVQAAQCEVNSVTLGAFLFDLPGAMVNTPDNRWLLVLDETAGDLKVIDTTEQIVITSLYLQGIEPVDLTIKNNQLYVVGAFNTGIVVVDISATNPKQWQVTKNWPINGDFTAVIPDPSASKLLIADRQVKGVNIISSTNGNQIANLTVPNQRCPLPVDLQIKNEKLFIACETTNIVAVFDLNTLEHQQNISVDKAPVNLIAHPTKEQLFVANNQAGTLNIINTAHLEESSQKIEAANLLTSPKSMAWLGNELWIVDSSQTQLVRYTNKLEASVCNGLGNRPNHLIALNNGLLYISDAQGISYAQVNTNNRRVKTHPQVLMAGFDPMLIDDNDNQVRILAVVEEGINPVSLVEYTLNRDKDVMRTPMQLVGSIHLGSGRYGLVYECAITFESGFLPHGSVAKTTFSLDTNSLFGGHSFQFTIIAQDNFKQTHNYPGWEYTFKDWPSQELFSPGMAIVQENYVTQGTHRELPQVIMAGFSPMLMDRSDEELIVMAIVRAGNSPIKSVTLNNVSDETIVLELAKIHNLPNSDQFYQGTIWQKQDNSVFLQEEFKSKKLWTEVWNSVFTVIAEDEAGNKHHFPDLQIGFFPKY